MANPGWSRSESPFHEGELALQVKAGAQARIDIQGRRMIRSYLIEQHRKFFARLSYVIVGSIDDSGALWASILTGEAGFLSTPDEHTLRVTAQPLPGDPFSLGLAVGRDIGVLGIELKTRRRNRINGVVSAVFEDGFELRVAQSFGNCPQYIQSRTVLSARSEAVSERVETIAAFSAVETAMILAADTFFIATAYQARSAGTASGVDVSHRGGNPGFVKIEGNDTLTIPDFSGNHHFNTLGNVLLNPQVGLVFIDFERGDLLYLTGMGEVIWEGPEIAAHEGAEHLLRFKLTQGYRVVGGLPLRWSEPAFSPFLS